MKNYLGLFFFMAVFSLHASDINNTECRTTHRGRFTQVTEGTHLGELLIKGKQTIYRDPSRIKHFIAEGEFHDKTGDLIRGKREELVYDHAGSLLYVYSEEGSFNEGLLIYGKIIGSELMGEGSFKNKILVEGKIFRDNELISDGTYDAESGFLIKGEDYYFHQGKKTTRAGFFENNILIEGKIFVNDVLIKKGQFDRNSGDIVRGYFRWDDGTETVGTFCNNMLLRGKHKRPDGIVEKGRFYEGILGEGSIFEPDGTSQHGRFENDRLVEGFRFLSDGAIVAVGDNLDYSDFTMLELIVSQLKKADITCLNSTKISARLFKLIHNEITFNLVYSSFKKMIESGRFDDALRIKLLAIVLGEKIKTIYRDDQEMSYKRIEFYHDLYKYYIGLGWTSLAYDARQTMYQWQYRINPSTDNVTRAGFGTDTKKTHSSSTHCDNFRK
jgi:hypothetical protein